MLYGITLRQTSLHYCVLTLLRKGKDIWKNKPVSWAHWTQFILQKLNSTHLAAKTQQHPLHHLKAVILSHCPLQIKFKLNQTALCPVLWYPRCNAMESIVHKIFWINCSLHPRGSTRGLNTTPYASKTTYILTSCVHAAERGSDEPLLLALINGFSEGWVIDDDRRISAVCWFCSLGLIGVVGSFMTEQVADHKHHDAEDSEDHHGDDAWKQNKWGLCLKEYGLGLLHMLNVMRYIFLWISAI